MIEQSKSANWLDSITLGKYPLVIAGPCSAETQQQLLDTASQIKSTPTVIYRAGIWKPRTRPGGFEGVGEIGLKWLQKVKEQNNFLVATEVATPTQIKLALEYDVDVLWIGARTAVNPFALQDIADTLKGTDKIVLLKNPVNPDLSLWLGGVERLQQADIKNIGVIHRGFSTYEKTKYRNIPEWQIAIDFKTKMPDIPMIIDPSHISGNRNLVFEIAQQALNLNYQGLMIETHIDPDNAWSDAPQQVTPHYLKQILEQLIIPKRTDSTVDFNYSLNLLRTQIDQLDQKLLEVLVQRMILSSKIGEIKKEKNVAILQEKRWSQILNNMIENAKQKGLNQDFVEELFKLIHQESINCQQ
ncbi:MAG: bifunctional 3-deoxy-7-phosphoheptulonate synthase/chorismate mutase type II [Bacteroidota bacterium]|nr:bifunctional 3-deoxy-7-phosphoheptulonate synthase/chorismate mutase type II [Bacteroidota bacterium]